MRPLAARLQGLRRALPKFPAVTSADDDLTKTVSPPRPGANGAEGNGIGKRTYDEVIPAGDEELEARSDAAR